MLRLRSGEAKTEMIKKVRVDDLEVGMFVCDFNVGWMEHPFLTNQKKLRSAREVDLLKKHRIEEVYIDTDRGTDSSRAVSLSEAEAELRREMRQGVLDEPASGAGDESKPRAGDAANFAEELHRARVVYGEAKTLVKDLLQDARMGRSIDGERAARAVDGMVDSIFRNRNALVSLTRLKSFDDYTFQHSLNVSVLALTLGRHLGIVKDELRRLGTGAILHDVGKMRIPEVILNKPGKLTDEEFTVIKTHTLTGAKILMETAEVPDECSAVALNHHERFDGGGYPRGLRGLNIGKFGLISAIADVYDAITSDRVYHKGMPSHQALQKIFEWGKTAFNPIYVQKFIQCIGIYPVGSVVRLDDGSTGVVCRQNASDLLRPVVRVVRDNLGEPLSPVLEIDLRSPDPRGEKPFGWSVQSALDPREGGFDAEAVLASESACKAA